jgi:hypothetical protein
MLGRECSRVDRGCQRGLYAVVFQGDKAAAIREGTKKPPGLLTWRLPGEGRAGRGATQSHATLNAEFFLQVFYPGQSVLELMTVDNLTTQFMNICLNPSHAGIQIIQAAVNLLKPPVHSLL